MINYLHKILIEMLSDKQDIFNFSTNTSNNNNSPERSTKKYQSARDLLFIPCNLRSNRKGNIKRIEPSFAKRHLRQSNYQRRSKTQSEFHR